MWGKGRIGTLILRMRRIFADFVLGGIRFFLTAEAAESAEFMFPSTGSGGGCCIH